MIERPLTGPGPTDERGAVIDPNLPAASISLAASATDPE
jgi:hypothetical protein